MEKRRKPYINVDPLASTIFDDNLLDILGGVFAFESF